MTPTSASGATARAGYHHGDLERTLVRLALEQVRDRGGDAVSLRQVAAAAGVSPSAAYSHFPNKTALLMAVAAAGMEMLDARMIQAVSLPGDDDAAAVARFRATGEAYSRFGLEEPHLFRHVFGPLSARAGDEDLAHLKSESVAFRTVSESLDALDARGLLRTGTRDGLDVAAWTMMHGFTSLALDGFLPVDLGPVLVDVLARLALADHALGLV
jgi:AcrR family transcriptional regulator